MKTSESIKELAAALSKAQGAMTAAKKDANNPHFDKKYADLASCWDAIRAPFAANGLAVVQTCGDSDKNEAIIVTRLLHTSGEWVESYLALPVNKADAQGYGSAITYARRYALCAIAGVAPEDDDGNAAKDARVTTKRERAERPTEKVEPLNQFLRDEWLRTIAETSDVETLRAKTATALEVARKAEDAEAHALFKDAASKRASALIDASLNAKEPNNES